MHIGRHHEEWIQGYQIDGVGHRIRMTGPLGFDSPIEYSGKSYWAGLDICLKQGWTRFA